MKASELRIGNLIYSTALEYCDVVTGISFDDEYEKYSIETRDYDDLITAIEGVKLTEEWLLKFGFVEERVGFFVSNIIQVSTKYASDAFKVMLYNPHIKEFWGIGYCEEVHQLQNLFFALCGEELTIKEA